MSRVALWNDWVRVVGASERSLRNRSALHMPTREVNMVDNVTQPTHGPGSHGKQKHVEGDVNRPNGVRWGDLRSGAKVMLSGDCPKIVGAPGDILPATICDHDCMRDKFN